MHNSTHTKFSAAANHFFTLTRISRISMTATYSLYQAFHFWTSTTILHDVDRVLFYFYYLKYLHILYLCYSDVYLLIFLHWLYFNTCDRTHNRHTCSNTYMHFSYVYPLPPSPFLPSLSPFLRSRPSFIQLGSPGSGECCKLRQWVLSLNYVLATV